MKGMLNVVKAVGLRAAKGTVNKASALYVYQLKSPDMLRERIKKKEK